MTAKILDGKILAGQIREKLSVEIAAMKEKTGAVPHLVNVMVGDDHGSCAYARSQKRVAEQVGIDYELLNLPQETTQDELAQTIQRLNDDETVHGIMIHKPLPVQIDYREVANFLDTEKDLEGINVANVGKMLLGATEMIPCTPAAVMEHIRSTGMDIRGKDAVIIGASEIVGKPLSLLLLREMATVSVCHVATSEAGRLQEYVGRAEILIVAVGRAHLIQGDWVRPGAIVVDVGINDLNGKMVGDVEFSKAQEKASYITPVPGGVGPVTVLMLMRNGISAFRSQMKGKL